MKTAIEQILDAIQKDGFKMDNLDIHHFLEIEKEQITNACLYGYVIGGGNGDLFEEHKYYNETFKINNNESN